MTLRILRIPSKLKSGLQLSGDVFPSPLPIGLVQGGEGGEYVVLGNWGWKGALPDSGGPVNGANGGDVVGQGGNGGDVLEGVLFQSAIGGDGANSEVAQARIIAELPVRPEVFEPPYGIGPSGFRSYGYGVIGGPGGDGSIPGENGLYLGEPPDVTLCASDGVPSGEGLTCDDDSTGGERCWTRLGSSFTAFYETSRKRTHPTRTNEWSETRTSLTETGRLVEITGQFNDRFRWDIVGTRVEQIRTWEGRDRDTTAYYTTSITNHSPGSPASEARTPRCINGELSLPFGSASTFYRNEYVYLDGFRYEDTVTLAPTPVLRKAENYSPLGSINTQELFNTETQSARRVTE